MNNRMLAVKAAMLAAAVAVIVAAAPAGAVLRDSDWSGGHLTIGRAYQTASSSSVSTASIVKARLLAAFFHPLKDWDSPLILPAPVISVGSDY